jgi:hypothetical protein
MEVDKGNLNQTQGQVFSRKNLQPPEQAPVAPGAQALPETQEPQMPSGLPVTPGAGMPPGGGVELKGEGGAGKKKSPGSRWGNLGIISAGLAIWGIIIWVVLKPKTETQTVNQTEVTQPGEKAEISPEPPAEDFTQTDEEVELPVIALMDDLTATQPPLEEEAVLNNALDQISASGQSTIPTVDGQIAGKGILDWLGISGAPEQGYEIGEISVTGDQAQVVVKMKFNSGVQERTFQLAKGLGGWKIEGVNK